MTEIVVPWLGWSFLAGAVAVATQRLRAAWAQHRAEAAEPVSAALPSRRRASPMATRLVGGAARRYDASAGGRRLERRLHLAAIDATPSRFRVVQALLVVPVALVMANVVDGALTATLISVTAIRLGGRVVVRSRRHRRDDLIESLVLVLARHLGTELAAGAAPLEAMRSARRLPGAATRPPARVLTSIVARAEAGETAALALWRAASAEVHGPGGRALARLSTVLDLAVDGGAGTGVLARLATGLEADRRTQADARAAMAEARVAATAVPLLAAAVGTMIVISGGPDVQGALLSFPALPILAGCIGISGCAAVTARRITSN